MKEEYDLTAFFHEMGNAFDVFRHKTMTIPGANINGCYVRKGKNSKANKMKVAFLAKDSSVVSIEIDIRDLFADPKRYIDLILEGVNSGLKQMSQQSRFILMPRLGTAND